MRTIAVVARKGGSGKTTVAVHLGIAAHLAGRTTVIVDTDPQQSAVEVFKMRKIPGPQCFAADPAGLLAAKFNASAAGIEAMLIDTPAGTEEGMSSAIVLADLTLLVIRPTFLDLAAAVRTAEVLRKLRKPCLVVLNQAPVAREGSEPPAVRKAREVLRLMRLPVVPVILRARASYQMSIESGCSAVETAPAGVGARELSEIWTYIERFAFPSPAESGRWGDRRASGEPASFTTAGARASGGAY
jgi:chromosome partitioning protein